MAERSGRANRLTGQLGEYLVAAELARRGLIATTFAGNVPHFDIVASDEKGRSVSVQVKTSNSDSWQLSLDRFCEIRFQGERQIIGAARPMPVKRLVVVFVMVGREGARDRFFVTPWAVLRRIVIRHHREWLAQHGGRRPRNPRSLHAAISAEELTGHEDGWKAVSQALR